MAIAVIPVAGAIGTILTPYNAVVALSLLTIFTEKAWGCDPGQLSGFNGQCPGGWKAVDVGVDRYMKFTKDDRDIGQKIGTETAVLQEEHIPQHSHYVAAGGSYHDVSGNYLNTYREDHGDNKGYSFAGTMTKPAFFRSSSYGGYTTHALPENPYIYARLCQCDGGSDSGSPFSSSGSSKWGLAGGILGMASLAISSTALYIARKTRIKNKAAQESTQLETVSYGGDTPRSDGKDEAVRVRVGTRPQDPFLPRDRGDLPADPFAAAQVQRGSPRAYETIHDRRGSRSTPQGSPKSRSSKKERSAESTPVADS